jgi:hypothetical protein
MLRYLVPDESIGSMVAWLKEVEKFRREITALQPSEAHGHSKLGIPLVSESEGSESPTISSTSGSTEAEPLSPVMPQEVTQPDAYVADWLFTQMTLEDVFHKLNAQVYQNPGDAADAATKAQP